MKFVVGNPVDTFIEEKLPFGRYQLAVLCLVCVPAALVDSYSWFTLVFLLYTPEHRCHLNHSDNADATAYQCFVEYAANGANGTREYCQEWDYSKAYFDETLVTRWNIVCDDKWKAKTVLSKSTAELRI